MENTKKQLDLPRHYRLQPGKTRMHSVYTQFYSCDAQQMNTVHNENASATTTICKSIVQMKHVRK